METREWPKPPRRQVWTPSGWADWGELSDHERAEMARLEEAAERLAREREAERAAARSGWRW